MYEIERSFYDCNPVKINIECNTVFTQIRDGRKLFFIVIEDYQFVQLHDGTTM